VTITIQLTPELEAALQARAVEQGVSLRDYVQSVIAQLATTERRPRVALEELDAALDEMAEDSDKIPVLPAEAYTRESIYKGR
jgi:hypothetical protein